MITNEGNTHLLKPFIKDQPESVMEYDIQLTRMICYQYLNKEDRQETYFYLHPEARDLQPAQEAPVVEQPVVAPQVIAPEPLLDGANAPNVQEDPAARGNVVFGPQINEADEEDEEDPVVAEEAK